MRSFIYFLLFLGVVTSSVYARKAVKVKRLDLLKDAASQMLKIPEFKGGMTWASGGVASDEFINYLSVHETKVYNLYDSELGLRLSLGKALNDAMNHDIFSLPIYADGKLVSKYFRGARPNLQAIISTVIATPELNAKMQWGSEGLSTDEIMAAVTELYPEVHTLYVQASANKTEHGLRIALGKALDEEMKGSVFSLGIDADGKYVRKYFRGARPDLQDIISTVIAAPELSAKMQWGSEGLSTDEIMAAVTELYPEVHTLYVQASANKKDHGLRIALGKALDEEMEGSVFSLHIDANGKKVKKYFRGAKPDLQDIISTVIAAPELNAKMQWGSEGLSTDEIMAAIKGLYPEVRTLYVQASANKNDSGLRVALGRALDEEMKGSVFSLPIGADGKKVKKYFRGAKPDLQDIISTVIAAPELNAKMQWGSEGLSMDEIMASITELYPVVHTLYVQASTNKTEHGLRTALGIALDEEMEGSVFSLPIGADGKRVSKYFRGAKPDLQDIISTVIAAPELSTKMQWGSEGLSTDEIMAAITELYPVVHTLYVQASTNKTEHGLRTALGIALDEEMEGSVFSLRIDADGKDVRKYFRGAKPDLQDIISTVIATPELNAKMQWGSEGLSTDEIMAAIIKLYPEVHTLYVQASTNKTEHGLRTALGRALDGVVVRRYSTGGVRYFWKE